MSWKLEAADLETLLGKERQWDEAPDKLENNTTVRWTPVVLAGDLELALSSNGWWVMGCSRG